MNQPPMMILAAVDDAGLSAVEFRVLAHVCRRAGEGQCWAALETISKTCRINVKTARAALRRLEENGWISTQKRQGQTSVLMPRTPTNPIPLPNGYPSQTNTQDPYQSDTPHPYQSDTPKGNPRREPIREPKRVAPPALPFPTESFQQTWTDWLQHRKELKKPVTPQSAKMAFKELAEMTEAEAIAAIRYSIKKGWRGIFPDPSFPKLRSTTEIFKPKTDDRKLRPFD